jgi:hypothetical protein
MTTSLDAPLPHATFEPQSLHPPRRLLANFGGFWREPLLHFVLLGGLLFAVDRALVDEKQDRQTIVVGADVDEEAVHTFEQARGRKPNEKELEALHRVWLDNEILYREGLELGLDKGDPMLRERIIFKAISVVDSQIKLELPGEQALRAWFESRRHKYDEPVRFDFEEAALSGENSEAAVRDFVKILNEGAPGDAKAGLRVFKARPRPNLVQSYDEPFAVALEKATPGVWQALKTREGWRAIRLTGTTPPKPAAYDSIRGMLLQDWKDEKAAEARTAKVREFGKKYQVKYEEHVNRHAGE